VSGKTHRRRIVAVLTAAILALGGVVVSSSTATAATGDAPKGLLVHKKGASPGYTLFAPLELHKTFLVDLNGKVVHTWKATTQPGLYQYLLADGSLVRAGNLKRKGVWKDAKGAGGRLEALDWNSNLKWRFDYADDDHMQHHDLAVLPNGHVLFLAWERKTKADALAAGRVPAKITKAGLWPDSILEYDPASDSIVWEWHVWDHLVQDTDPTKPSYGVVEDHPEKIDLNYTLPAAPKDPDWNHANAVAYNPDLDQIVISSRSFSEFWIVNHATTTEEARGPAGDLLFRYGNPATYGKGDVAPRQLFFQHDVEWIPDGLPGAGHLIAYNNGAPIDRAFSTADEIIPVVRDGAYVKDANGAFRAARLQIYPHPDNTRWFGAIISGVERLPNANTLITDGTRGHIFEVTPTGETVWDYVNPHYTVRPDTPKSSGAGFVIRPWWTFRADRYPPDYPAFQGKQLG
jgi:hypothetical protein